MHVPNIAATHDLELEQDKQDNRAEVYNHLLKPIRYKVVCTFMSLRPYF